MTVLSHLLWERGMGERLRRGDGLFDSARKSVATTIAGFGYPSRYSSPAEFVDSVVEEVRSTLLAVSGHTGEY